MKLIYHLTFYLTLSVIFAVLQQNSAYNVGYKKEPLDQMQKIAYRYNLESLYKNMKKENSAEAKPFLICEKMDNYDYGCDPSYPYRRPNGVCNNLEHTWWGRSFTPYSRLAPPDYDNFISSPRTKSSNIGDLLPNARNVSANVLAANPVDTEFSAAFTYFGQFVSHDLVGTPDDGKECFCDKYDRSCINIEIQSTEANLAFKGQSCIPMKRNLNSKVAKECNFGFREQETFNTHWLDNDNIYGNSDKNLKKLRLGHKGLLKSSTLEKTDSVGLPIVNIEACKRPGKSFGCFIAGDSRAEQNVMLTAMHTIFLREHNRIAGILYKLNPHWKDETLFQETRRIINAIYQHIIYVEFLPLLIGPELMEIFHLNPLKKGYLADYDNYLLPQIYNEFGIAGFRLHSLVHFELHKADANFFIKNDFSLTDATFNVSDSYQNLDANAIGMLLETTYPLNPQIADDLNNHLFEGVVKPIDNFSGKPRSLGAINIQRGRDHGVRSYNEYRELSGLKKAETFDDFTNIPEINLQQIIKYYKNVNDVDLFVGCVSEARLIGAKVGATMANIIGRQFHRLKFGDRFFYENDVTEATRFSLEQLDEIRHYSFSKLYCRNLGLPKIQKNGFLQADDDGFNPLIPCNELPDIDLKLWQEHIKKY